MENKKSIVKEDLEYISPSVKEFVITPRRVICGSETEKVEETDGEW